MEIGFFNASKTDRPTIWEIFTPPKPFFSRKMNFLLRKKRSANAGRFFRSKKIVLFKRNRLQSDGLCGGKPIHQGGTENTERRELKTVKFQIFRLSDFSPFHAHLRSNDKGRSNNNLKIENLLSALLCVFCAPVVIGFQVDVPRQIGH